MSIAQSEGALPAELEAIASAQHDRLHAQAGPDLSAQEAAQRHPGDRASPGDRARAYVRCAAG